MVCPTQLCSSAEEANALLVRLVSNVSYPAWGTYLKGVVASLLTLIGLRNN